MKISKIEKNQLNKQVLSRTDFPL